MSVPSPVPLAPDLAGRLLPGGFRLDEAVAEGASGIVVRATQASLGRKVAVKISHEADEAAVARARREAQIVAALDAPGIVRVYASGQLEDGRAWVAMEWIEGSSLEEALERGPLSVPRALAIAAQIARALDHAHRAGIIHRDLKPANVMLRPGDRVVVVDFGIARVTAHGPGGSASRLAGTPHYMAPEQAAGEDIDVRADLYALGGVLYRMLAGRVAFGGSAIEVMLGHLHSDPPPLPPSVPREVDALVRALLSKRPEERPGPAAAVGAELDRLATAAWQRTGLVDPSGATLAAMTITPPAASVSGGRGRGRRWLVGGALAAAVAAVVAVVSLQGGERGEGAAALDGGVDAAAVVVPVVDAGVDGREEVAGGDAPDVVLVDDGGWAMKASRPPRLQVGAPAVLTLEIWDADGAPAKAGTLAFTVRAPDGTTRAPPKVAGEAGRFALELEPRQAGRYVVTVFAPAGETTLAVEIDVEA